ncbi:MAG: hypothetical protein DRI46_07320 [Chloroflexi bacterium]|nr:MAG: hypothetical protein DRI46_07320 [Chloroflexota bacterium]
MYMHESNKNVSIVLNIGGKLRTRTIYTSTFIAGLLLLTSCIQSANLGSTSTPDPGLMDVIERTIWDFEIFRDEVNDLAAEAANTPVEDLEPICLQMVALTEEIEGYEYPLFAASAQSALYNFSYSTNQCCGVKFGEYLNKGPLPEHTAYHCDNAQVYKESFDTYLQELKEMYAEK